jgi:dimethylaniline monooxygenase (N-oxide forming)
LGFSLQVVTYLEAYAKHFEIADKVTYQTTVLRVVPISAGQDGYHVELRDDKSGNEYSREYASVVVCSGHHWDPIYPELPGKFSGEIIHAHDYRTPAVTEGKRVLVLGVGNSGTASFPFEEANVVYVAAR